MKPPFYYRYVLEYLPIHYSASCSKRADRPTVYNFKNGFCNQRIFDGVVSAIKEMAENNKSEYVTCFISASSQSRTDIRYGNVNNRRKMPLAYDVTIREKSIE